MSTVAVVGASGRTGRAVTDALVEAGHEVVAVCRTTPIAPADPTRRGAVRYVPNDVLVADDVDRALRGVDSVVVALGIAENPLRVRLRGARGTAGDVRSRGTRNVLSAMRAHGIRRIVVLSSYGVGDSAGGLSAAMRVVFAALLAPQMRDHAEQEALVRASDAA